jgi:hypothetical protein
LSEPEISLLRRRNLEAIIAEAQLINGKWCAHLLCEF